MASSEIMFGWDHHSEMQIDDYDDLALHYYETEFQTPEAYDTDTYLATEALNYMDSPNEIEHTEDLEALMRECVEQLHSMNKIDFFSSLTPFQIVKMCSRCANETRKQTNLLEQMESKSPYFIVPCGVQTKAEVKYMPNMRDVKDLDLRKLAISNSIHYELHAP